MNTWFQFSGKNSNGSIVINFKQTFQKSEGQYDLEGQGQGHKFSNSSESFVWSIRSLNLKVKFQTVQC